MALKRLKPAVLLASVALVAALIGHVAIDVLGDFMLTHDTYDDLNHSSRTIVALVTIAPTMLGIVMALRAVIREASGSENALCIALRSALPSNPPAFLIAAVFASTLVLCAMEGCDAIVAGQPVDDLGDLFGGSVAFGGVIVALCAVVVGLTTLSCLRRLSEMRLVAGIVVAFLRRDVRSSVVGKTHVVAPHRLIFHDCDICHRVAGRAPPLPGSVTTT